MSEAYDRDLRGRFVRGGRGGPGRGHTLRVSGALAAVVERAVWTRWIKRHGSEVVSELLRDAVRCGGPVDRTAVRRAFEGAGLDFGAVVVSVAVSG